jgi:hypothetical protein
VSNQTVCIYSYLQADFVTPLRAHVAQDLVPYTCIMENCDNADEMYLTAENLMAHTLEKHSLVRWTCDYCSTANAENTDATPVVEYFGTATEWMEHVTKCHADDTTAEERDVLVGLSEQRILLPLDCPLCPFTMESTGANIDAHILLHLHEFSLLALPEHAWETNEKTRTMSQGSDALSYIRESKPDVVVSYEDQKLSYTEVNSALQLVLSHIDRGEGDLRLTQPRYDESASSVKVNVEWWHTHAYRLMEIADALVAARGANTHCETHISSCLHLSMTQVGVQMHVIQDLVNELNYAASYNMGRNTWGKCIPCI